MKNILLKRPKKYRFWSYTVLIAIATIALSSCSKHRAIRLRNKSIKEWSAYRLEVIKESSHRDNLVWTISSRKIKGTNKYEYQIEGVVGSEPSNCIASFAKEIKDQAADMNNKKYPIYDIVHESDDSLLTYVIHNEPFPLKDTEMSVAYLFHDSEDGNFGVRWHEVWGEQQKKPSKKLKRIELFRGSWNFEPMAGDSCKATNMVQFDPKKMPRWFFEPMVVKFLKNGLENLNSN